MNRNNTFFNFWLIIFKEDDLNILECMQVPNHRHYAPICRFYRTVGPGKPLLLPGVSPSRRLTLECSGGTGECRGLLCRNTSLSPIITESSELSQLLIEGVNDGFRCISNKPVMLNKDDTILS